MRKFIALLAAALLVWAPAAYAGDTAEVPSTTGGVDGTVSDPASLPTCNATTNGHLYKVTDCTAEDDCSASGGGHTELMQCDNGDGWQLVGDGTTVSGADSVEINHAAATDPDFANEGAYSFIRCTGAGAPDEECVAAEDVLLRENNVVDWDPDVIGTNSAGLQEAIDACGAGPCTIQQRPDTTYDYSTHNFSTDGIAATITSTETGIHISCHPSSRIIFSGDTGTTSPIHLFLDETEDFAITGCNWAVTETCTGASCTGQNVIINIQEDVDGVLIEGNTLSYTDSASGSATYKASRAILIGTNDVDGDVNNVQIIDNNIHAAERAISAKIVDPTTDAHWTPMLISGNYIDFDGRPTTGSTDSATARGITVRGPAIVTNNVIDCVGGWTTAETSRCGGIHVLENSDNSPPLSTDVSRSAVISGNIITGISQDNAGIQINAGIGILVSNNVIVPGQCSEDADKTCLTDFDCTGTCDDSDAYGVFIDAQTGDSQAYNRGNVITGNVFGNDTQRFIDDDTNAPITIEIQVGTDATENTSNLISNNLFWLDDTTDDGFADVGGGAVAARLAEQIVWGNVVVGATDEEFVSFHTGVKLTDGTNTYCLGVDGTAIYQDDNCDGSQGANEEYINVTDLNLGTYTISGGTASRCARFDGSGNLASAGADCNTGSGAFDDSGDPIVPNDTLKDLVLGTNVSGITGKVEIGGDADQTQLVIKGHTSQVTNPTLLLIEDSSGTNLLTLANDGDLTISGQISTGSSANPTTTFNDSDTSAEDSDATIAANCTDCADGSEDVDITFNVQVNSTLTERLKIDADGNVEITAADGLAVNASDPADAGVIRLDNNEAICWEASPTGTDTCLSVNASEAYVFDALDCSAANTFMTTDASGVVSCAAASSGGSAIIFDIGDDSGNDSTDLSEIATTGDDNSIFTEPSADKMLIDLGNNWPAADAIPSATNPTVDGTDNIAIDTDGGGVEDGQLLFYDGTQVRVAPGVQQECKVIQDLAAADDNLPFFMNHAYLDINLLSASCGCIVGTCTTEADISFDIDEVTSGTDSAVTGTVACEDMDNAGGPTEQALSVNTNMDQFDVLKFDVDNAVSPETDDYVICVSYEIVRQ